MKTNQEIAQIIQTKFASIFQNAFSEDHCFEIEGHRRCRETGSLHTHGFTNNQQNDTHLVTITHSAKMDDHPPLAFVRRDIVSRMLTLVLQDTPLRKNQFISANRTVIVLPFVESLLTQLDQFVNRFEYYAGVRSCADSYADVLSIIVLLKDANKADRLSIKIDISSKSFKVMDPKDLFVAVE